MMKQEFDKIAKEKYGRGECSQWYYDTEIEPTYLEFGDLFDLTKDEMVRMVNGVGPDSQTVWLALRELRLEMEVARSLLGKAKEIYKQHVHAEDEGATEVLEVYRKTILEGVRTILRAWRNGIPLPKTNG